MANTLLAASVFAFIAGVVYLVVGRVVEGRRVSDRHRLANRIFAVWWYALGFSTLVTGAITLLAVRNLLTLNLHVTATLLNLFAICVALWALLYYLVYLFTAKHGVIAPLTVAYVLYYFALVYVTLNAGPIGTEVRAWNVALEYERPFSGSLRSLLILFLVLPQILGAVAFFTLRFQVSAPEQKFRITVVSWSIIIWFGSTLAAGLTGVSMVPAWNLVSRILGLGAALAILIAYKPPGLLQRRLERGATSPPEAGTAKEAKATPAAPATGSPAGGRSSPTGTAS